MAQIAVSPYVFKNAIVQIKNGATDLGTFETAVSEAIVSPNVDTVVWRGAVPSSVFKDTSSPDWSASLKFAQDFATAGSLSNVLFSNPGAQLQMILTANNVGATPKKLTFTFVAVPGNFGGTVGSVAEDGVTLPVIGQPVLS